MKRAANGALRGAWVWLAWVALAMLAAQPAAATMMPSSQGRTVVVEICSSHSPGKTMAVHLPGAPAQTSDCLKCPSCLAAPVAIEPAAPVIAAQSVSYRLLTFAGQSDPSLGLARAPPRPPGQGPPNDPNA